MCVCATTDYLPHPQRLFSPTLYTYYRLSDMNKVIGIDLLSQSLLPAVVELAEDKQWRVR